MSVVGICRAVALVAAVALPAVALAPAPARADMAEGVVAIVNDEVISSWDIRQRAAWLLFTADLEINDQAIAQVAPQALRQLESERLQLQEAQEFDLVVDEASIDRRFEDLARSREMSGAEFAQMLARRGISPASIRQQIRANVAWQRIVYGRFGSRIRISDARLNETIERISQSVTKPHVLMSEILIPADTSEQRQQAMETAGQLLSQMRRGTPFPLIARQFSAAPSAATDGDIGWLPIDEVRPELREAANTLQRGQVSSPIMTGSGVYLIAVRNRQAGVDPAEAGRVTLMQIAGPAGIESQLSQALGEAQGCDAIEAAVIAAGGQAVLLGQSALGELTPEVRAAVADVRVGRTSPLQRQGDGVTALAVCDRGIAGVPSREQVEDELIEQELAMLAQRYLRNLRREATILYRLEDEASQPS